MADLKLGRLPKTGVVRMTIGVAEPLKEELDRYAAEYSRLYEPVDAATLIPHMLEAFIRSDRGYRSRRARSQRGETHRQGVPEPAQANGTGHPQADSLVWTAERTPVAQIPTDKNQTTESGPNSGKSAGEDFPTSSFC